MRRPALLAVALLAAGCAGDEPPAVPDGRHVSVSRSVEPKAAFFGEPVTARVDVVVDTRHLDPERVRVVPRTFPYRPYTELSVTRRDTGRYARLTFEVGLRCLYYACLPTRLDAPGIPSYRDQRVTRWRAWHVYYDEPGKKAPRHLARVWWPSLEAVSNLDLTDVRVTFQQSPGRIEQAPLPAVTYRLSPPLLAALLLLGAALALVYPALLVRRWRVSRRPPPPPPPPPLERALLLVEWARERVDGEDRRKALEELAFRLDELGRDEQARAARRLAWSPGSPSPDAADELVAEVRRGG